eukprot:TRINITY_DN8636_c0_g1_i1.p1 TRINITY_DN8636_c0_g1~~TRINITY_DN8636_c0_g1_i1.p1  ORF type:complete len:222 (-),score=45.12 TRINITY_DN8636_c0_g1_i1:9-674(-)
MLVPKAIYNNVLIPLVWPQIILDLVPEILFWQTYVVLVLLWASMYHAARNMGGEVVQNMLNKVFIGVSAISYVSIGIMAIVSASTHTYKTVWEAAFLTTLSLLTVICLVVYGYLLYKRTTKLSINPETRRDTMLRKLKWVVIIMIVCNVTHTIYLICMDILTDNFGTTMEFPWIWFSYLLLTEVVPGFIILALFKKVPHIDRTRSITYAPLVYSPTRKNKQ